MPLFDISVNIPESKAVTSSRKRTHDEFTKGNLLLATDVPSAPENTKSLEHKMTISPAVNGTATKPGGSAAIHVILNSPPGSSSPAGLSVGCSTAEESPSPNRTPPQSQSPPASHAPNTTTDHTTTSTHTGAPSKPTMPSTTPTQASTAVKRKRKTAAEKEAEDREREEKRRKKEEEHAAKAAEKARAEAEKQAKKEARDLAKAEKAKLDAEKQAERDAKRRKKEEEEEKKRRKQEEEEAKKLRQQQGLLNFLKPKKHMSASPSPTKPLCGLIVGSPNPVPPTRDADSPLTQDKKSEYETRFQPFFVKADVKLAPPPFEMTDETKEAKSTILDEYLHGERGDFNAKPFDPVKVFELNGNVPRGIRHTPVKDIMAKIFGDPVDNALGIPPIRTDSQAKRYSSAQDQLNAIPMKFLRFYEDVRPPYVGTITSHMTHDLYKLGRRPTGRILPRIDYNYDSEAEWQEDEGEDVDDCDEDDDDNDGEEEMADFLDDAEEVAVTRPAFLGNMEPASTGICFENRKRLGPCAKVYKYRLEFLLESLEHHSMIDPFSTQYWEPKILPAEAATATAHAQASSAMPPPPAPTPAAPTDAFALLTAPGPSAPFSTDEKDLVPKDILEDFKRAILSADVIMIPQAGTVDMLTKRFDLKRKQVENTLKKIATRVPVPNGRRKTDKQWALLPAFAVSK